MTVVLIPVREVNGVAVSGSPLSNASLKVCSHGDQTLLTLCFQNQVIVIEASRLRDAIQSIADDRVNSNRSILA
jgi:hypothetical protein